MTGSDEVSVDGAVAAEESPRRGAGSRVLGWLRELAIVAVIALVLSFLIKMFVFQSFWIPSGSMESTLAVGDRILVSVWRPGPLDVRHGDIVVFSDPGGWLDSGAAEEESTPVWREALTFVGLLPQDEGTHLVKRVIGLPGDEVKCCDNNGQVTVNGFPLDEPYLGPGIEPSRREFTTVVPEGHVWVMGDNRPASGDSRSHRGNPGGGSIPIDSIVGTAFAVAWPLSNATTLSNPFTDVTIPPASAGTSQE